MVSKTASVIIVAVIAIVLQDAAYPYDSDIKTFKPDAEKLRLIEKASARWSTVNRWLIEYEAVTLSSGKIRGTLLHRIVGVSAPGDLYHLTAHIGLGQSWQYDPAAKEIFIHEGSVRLKWPFQRAYWDPDFKLQVGGQAPGLFWNDVLFEVIPVCPLSYFKTPVDSKSGMPIIPIDALCSADYRLLSKSESIAGEDCAIFCKEGTDQIWVAANKGLCIMQRDVRDTAGRLRQRIIVDKVQQVAADFWLPAEFRNQLFIIDQGTNGDKMGLESKVRILRCVLNTDVPESTFIPVSLPGSIEYDGTNQFTQMTPGGEDLLDDDVNLMVKYAHLPTKLIPRMHPYIWLFAGMAGGLGGGLFFFPIRKTVSQK